MLYDGKVMEFQKPILLCRILIACAVAWQVTSPLQGAVAFPLAQHLIRRRGSILFRRKIRQQEHLLMTNRSVSNSRSGSSSINHTTNNSLSSRSILEPWCGKSNIDYSAANEYVYAHYYNVNKGTDILRNTPYFIRGNFVADEPIYDARNNGYYDDNIQDWVPPSLSRCGFTLVHAPTAVTNFRFMEQIEKKYLGELREVILTALEREQDSGSVAVKHIIFWHPMFRGDGFRMSELRKDGEKLSTAPVAPLVHIDTDIGAMDVQMLLRLVENNCVNVKRSNEDDDNNNCSAFPYEDLKNELNSGKRFVIINAWRNADIENKQPVERSPLGLLAARFDENNKVSSDGINDEYRSNQNDEQHGQHGLFPTNRPNPNTSRWYTYPHMTTDECLLFKQYDRRLDQPSDIWHCALGITNNGEIYSVPSPAPRRSFDIRALVVLDEIVPSKNDRFLLARRPLLTHEESGCFCDEQTKKRQEEDTRDSTIPPL